MLPSNRAESGFKDFKPSFASHEAEEEASRCLYCYDAPCITACPTGINIPQFIGRIAGGNVIGAAKTISDSNIMGLSCARSCPVEVLCEGSCVHNDLSHNAIKIGKLQRYAMEQAYAQGASFYTAGKPTGKRVALIGAGPASLACAHELRKAGHAAVIFERSKIPGGLNTTGIAPYKMKADTSLAEITQVQKLGAEIKYGQELGKDIQLEKLAAEYDAVFLGMGLGPDSRLDAPGAGHPRIVGAVEFIAKIKTLPAGELAWLKNARSALIVGGGNTALDACREMKGLGLANVIVSYRRGEEDMSGYAHELKAARQEGVEFRFFTLPTEFMASGERVQARLRDTRVVNGKVELADHSETIAFDLVLVATGQAKLESMLKGVSGLSFEKGRLVVDAWGATGNAKIYAGGDLANGGKEVVNAVAEGKRAAQAIDAKLMGKALSATKPKYDPYVFSAEFNKKVHGIASGHALSFSHHPAGYKVPGATGAFSTTHAAAGGDDHG